MRTFVTRWATIDRRTRRYLRRGFSWAQDRWVRNPALATLEERRGDWKPDRGQRRVKVLVTARPAMVLLCLLALSASALAQQAIPIRYRVTRTAPGQPTLQHVFLKSAMNCNLAIAAPPDFALRIGDPERSARDCEWRDLARALTNGMAREADYTFTIAGQANDIDPYGPESNAVRITLPRIPQIPPAPGNFRLTPPPTEGVAVLGTVLDRFHWGGLDVAQTWLDVGAYFYIGTDAPNGLQMGAYRVERGDRFYFSIAHP